MMPPSKGNSQEQVDEKVCCDIMSAFTFKVITHTVEFNFKCRHKHQTIPVMYGESNWNMMSSHLAIICTGLLFDTTKRI